ncbi:MAG: ComF family protein [Bacteroidia bacterium]|nr:ComF family protein [Bacteroidia bacterium]
MNLLKKAANDLISLFYPETCAACKQVLYQNENTICTKCLLNLPYTHCYKTSPSIYNKIFWGKFPVQEVWPLFVYQKKSGVQHILHQIKYKENPFPAEFLAKLLAGKIKEKQGLPNAQAIIPVPMHPKKQRERGYNQAQYIAQGLFEVWNIEIRNDLIKKVAHTKTQTKRGRISRFENMSETFSVINSNEIKKLSGVILADDVITTGATLEAIAQLLLKENPSLKIYIATLAAA